MGYRISSNFVKEVLTSSGTSVGDKSELKLKDLELSLSNAADINAFLALLDDGISELSNYVCTAKIDLVDCLCEKLDRFCEVENETVGDLCFVNALSFKSFLDSLEDNVEETTSNSEELEREQELFDDNDRKIVVSEDSEGSDDLQNEDLVEETVLFDFKTVFPYVNILKDDEHPEFTFYREYIQDWLKDYQDACYELFSNNHNLLQSYLVELFDLFSVKFGSEDLDEIFKIAFEIFTEATLIEIIESIRVGIENERLAMQEKIPSQRDLNIEFMKAFRAYMDKMVSLNTLTSFLEQLGYIKKHTSSGFIFIHTFPNVSSLTCPNDTDVYFQYIMRPLLNNMLDNWAIYEIREALIEAGFKQVNF